jgi:thioredoxin-like negative regulator of GroEL
MKSEDVIELIETNPIVVVRFWADWSMLSKRNERKFNIIKEENPKLCFLSLDINKYLDLGKKYNVNSIPLFVLFKDGEYLKEINGNCFLSSLRKEIKDCQK